MTAFLVPVTFARHQRRTCFRSSQDVTFSAHSALSQTFASVGTIGGVVRTEARRFFGIVSDLTVAIKYTSADAIRFRGSRPSEHRIECPAVLVLAAAGKSQDAKQGSKKPRKQAIASKFGVKVETRELSGSQMELQIDAPASMTKAVFDEMFANAAQSIDIKGFQKGKVPAAILQQHLDMSLFNGNAVRALMDAAMDLALQQLPDLSIVAKPEVSGDVDKMAQEIKPNQPFSFKATVAVWPKIELGTYTGMTIVAEEVQADIAHEVKQVMNDYQYRVAETRDLEVERPVQMGDVVLVDFNGIQIGADGVRMEEEAQETKDFSVELQSKKYVDGFAEGIVGMKKGETREIIVTFPVEYPAQDMAGKTMVFVLTVKGHKEKVLPPLDDTFAMLISDFNKYEDLLKHLTNEYETKIKEENDNRLAKAINRALGAIATAQFPEVMVDDAIKRQFATALKELAEKQNLKDEQLKPLITQEKYAAFSRKLRPSIERQLIVELAHAELSKRENLVVQDAEVEKELEASKNDILKKKMSLADASENIRYHLQKQAVYQFMKDNNKIEFVKPGELAALEPDEDEEGLASSLLLEDDEVKDDMGDDSWLMDAGFVKDSLDVVPEVATTSS